jgi:hypothetical protein
MAGRVNRIPTGTNPLEISLPSENAGYDNGQSEGGAATKFIIVEPALALKRITGIWINDGYVDPVCNYCEGQKFVMNANGSAEIWRLDQSGTVLELLFMNGTQDDFPDRIDPDIAAASHISYWIYYRG